MTHQPPACPACKGRSRDGHLCPHCTRRLAHRLEEIPWLYLETRRAALGMVRLGPTSDGGKSGAEPPMPVNLTAAAVARRVLAGVGTRNGLVGWVRITIDDLDAHWPDDRITRMVDHLIAWLPQLRKHENAAELVADVRDWTYGMLDTINRPRWHRVKVPGGCPLVHEDAPCPGALWAIIPDDEPAYIACDTCSDGDADPVVGVWAPQEWARLGRRLVSRREAVKAQQRLAAEVLGRVG